VRAVWAKHGVNLCYTRPALADLSAILDYISTTSPQGARRVQARIQALTDLLLLHPHIGRCANDPAIRRMTTALTPIWFSTRLRRPRSSFMPFDMRLVTRPECRVPPDQ
jgi:plasmid stabilization system protein ParE